jgi:hypothetical protein
MHVQRDVRLRMSDGVMLKANVYRPADRSGQPIETKTPVLVNLTPYSKLIFSMAGEAANNPVLWPLLEQIVASVNLTGTPIASTEQLLELIKGGGIAISGRRPPARPVRVHADHRRRAWDRMVAGRLERLPSA